MEPLNLTVTVSNIVDLSASSVRGLWFKQDFFSDHCKTFNGSSEKYESLKASVAYEDHVRKTMIEKHLNEMRAVREVWEKKMEKIRLEEEKNNKGSRKKPAAITAITPKKLSSTKLKVEIEPTAVDETTYVDVEAEYCAFELQEFNEERKSLLTESLGLKKFEASINQSHV